MKNKYLSSLFYCFLALLIAIPAISYPVSTARLVSPTITGTSTHIGNTVQTGNIALTGNLTGTGNITRTGAVTTTSTGTFLNVKPYTEPGTVNTGVTAVTYGDGKSFITILTVSKTDAVDVADNAALSDGYLLYTLPAGPIVIQAAYMSMGVTLAEDTTSTMDGGLGTTIGSGAQSVLSGVGAGAENILTGQAFNNGTGTAEVKTVADQVLVIETADNHTIYFNIADTWANTAGSDLTGDIAGTITIHWVKMS